MLLFRNECLSLVLQVLQVLQRSVGDQIENDKFLILQTDFQFSEALCDHAVQCLESVGALLLTDLRLLLLLEFACGLVDGLEHRLLL